jgi:hypothetical protein
VVIAARPEHAASPGQYHQQYHYLVHQQLQSHTMFQDISPGSFEGMKAYRAPSLFQPHRARQAIRDAHEKKIPPLIGYYAGLSSVPITRYLAPMGYDAVWIDWEHTSCNVETMTTVSSCTV